MEHAGLGMDHDRLVAAHRAATSPLHFVPQPLELLNDLVGHAWLYANDAAPCLGESRRGVG